MRQNHFRERIIEALRQHPEGLTTVDIARVIGSHRHTITKYVYQLVGEGMIHQREIGNAKLCYMKGEENGK
jgi:DNA-binding IclR family transcriptional regulator